jgi:hypothetical protein
VYAKRFLWIHIPALFFDTSISRIFIEKEDRFFAIRIGVRAPVE